MDLSENNVIGKIEKQYLTCTRNKIYVALEDIDEMDFIWSEKEVRRFDELWDYDIPLKEITEELNATQTSVFLLAFDRVMKGKINGRKNWRIW